MGENTSKEIITRLLLGAVDSKMDAAFLDGMREAAEMYGGWVRINILEEVARRAKSGNVRQKTGLAERSDAEASATPQKTSDAS